jgi:hypothetical protein
MAKEYQYNWRMKIPDQLLQGDIFDRYDDVSFWLRLKFLTLSFFRNPAHSICPVRSASKRWAITLFLKRKAKTPEFWTL